MPVVSSGAADGVKTIIAVTSGGTAGAPVVSAMPAAPAAADNKVKTPRWVLSEDAKSRLEGVYQQHKFPTLVIREQLSAELSAELVIREQLSAAPGASPVYWYVEALVRVTWGIDLGPGSKKKIYAICRGGGYT